MRFVITGARGVVGTALSRRLQLRHEVAALTHAQLDVTDEEAVNATIAAHRPDVVINCAVLGVDTCEKERELAQRVNVDGARHLARAASANDAAIVHFSTNYVFDGERTDRGFYVPEDEARPINNYGATKLEGERAVRQESSRACIVRTSWVFGSGASTFLSTLPSKLKGGEPIVAIPDRHASTTWVEDLASRVEEIIALEAYGIFHVNNGGACSYADIADEVASILSLPEETREALIERRSADLVVTLAPRPRWTPMKCTTSERLGLAPLRTWKEALAVFCDREIR